MIATAEIESPELGEVTRAQSKRGASVVGSGGAAITWQAPTQGTYDIYRQMSAQPTLALAKACVVGPILASGWSYEAKDGTDDDRVEFIRQQMEALRPDLMRDCLRALEFGWQGFEKVFEVKENQLRLARLKPLLQDITEILVDGGGSFAGLQQGERSSKVMMGVEKSFLYTYDAECGNMYGRARHENARETWQQWRGVNTKAEKYQTKVAGTLCQIHYPPGKSENASGQQVENYILAMQLANDIAAGKTVFMPNMFSGGDDAAAQADLAGKSAWIISFTDAGSANHGSGFIDERRYLDSLLVRSWLRPERSVLEGQNGTKAEAETHGDVGLLDSELVHGDIVRSINRQIVDELLVLNFGEAARGSVYISPAPIVDVRIARFFEILKMLAADPLILAKLQESLDVDALLDALGIPKSKEVVDLDDETPTPETTPTTPATTPVASPVVSPVAGAGNDNAAAPAVNADLLSTVGALNAVLAVIKAYYAGELSKEAGVAYLIVMFQMDTAKAIAMFPETTAVDLTAGAGEAEPADSPMLDDVFAKQPK